MDTVTNILAFSAAHADYWTEFLSGQDYSSILSADEMRALEAARLHIEEGVYDLLFECGAKLAEKLKVHGVVTRNFQRGPTSRNRKVRLDPPPSCVKWLYGFEFEFSHDNDKRNILLYGSLVVKKGEMSELRKKLEPLRLGHRIEDYYIYKDGLALKEGQRFDALASAVAGDVEELFLAMK